MDQNTPCKRVTTMYTIKGQTFWGTKNITRELMVEKSHRPSPNDEEKLDSFPISMC